MNEIFHGDALDILKTLEDESVDLLCTDPPYGLEFMGKSWDTFKEGRGDKYAKGGQMNEVSIPGTGFKKLPGYTQKPAARCGECGKQAWSGSPCKCENPRWEVDNSTTRAFRKFTEEWSRETLRVLKPGAFMFAFSSPRSDLLAAMTQGIQDAGFRVDFTPIYWTYASGFPKAMNIGKAVDKRGGSDGMQRQRDDELAFVDYLRSKRGALTNEQIDEHLGLTTGAFHFFARSDSNRSIPTRAHYRKLKTLLGLDARFDEWFDARYELYEAPRERSENPNAIAFTYEGASKGQYGKEKISDTGITLEAKALDGSYGGFQPKPAVEVIIVAMKPLSEKTYVDQALKNGKGVTWLDDCRVPTNANLAGGSGRVGGFAGKEQENKGLSEYRVEGDERGRFPANLLVSDDVLNDGKVRKSGGGDRRPNGARGGNLETGFAPMRAEFEANSGSYSRFFSLDAWAQTLPFLIVPKASKSEKNAGVENLIGYSRFASTSESGQMLKTIKAEPNMVRGNFHPTVKPLKLMSYLITLGSRPGDLVLDPFVGSGTTCIAAKELGRQFIGVEKEDSYVEIARARIAAVPDKLL